MIKRTFIGIVIGFFMILVSCAQNNSINGVKDISGYIMSGNGDSVLVIEQTNGSEPRAAVYTITEETTIVSEDGESLPKTELSVGMEVAVWHTGTVQESFPTQATAVKIVMETSEGAIKDAKAIRAAKESLDPNITWWVKLIEEEAHLYTITFAELMGQTETNVKVNEKFEVIK